MLVLVVSVLPGSAAVGLSVSPGQHNEVNISIIKHLEAAAAAAETR